MNGEWSSLAMVGALFLGGLSIAMILRGLGWLRSGGRLAEHLEEITDSKSDLAEMELSRPFVDRAIKPLVRRLLESAGRLTPQRNIQQLERKLISAGRPYGLSALDFMGVRVIAGLVLGVAAGLVLQRIGWDYARALLGAVAVGAVGMYLPALWLSRRVSTRKEEIARALPDVLDTLSVCVDAGLGFDAAVIQVCEKFHDALADELHLLGMEIRMGVARETALRHLAERVDLRELSSWVATIIQSQQLGVGVAHTLRVQASESRQRRSQRAEEQARTLPVKMLFPLIFFIFPAIMVVVLGPSIPIFMELFTSVLGP